MSEPGGTLIDTDILVIGAGAGGLLAALSAKRHGAPGTRVTIADTWLVGRTGHTAFSNAWTVVVEPDETFAVTLSNPTNAVLQAPSFALVTIQDDEDSDADGLQVLAASRGGCLPSPRMAPHRSHRRPC